MRYALTGLLLAGSTCAFVLATPAVAQVSGNPGDLHTPTVYTAESRSQAYATATPGFGGPLGPLGILAAPITAPVAAMNGIPSGGACGVSQDFNGRLTALCGL
jgi:hypothetical protein